MNKLPKILLSFGMPTPVSHYHLYVDGVEKAGGIAELRLYPEAEPEKYDGLLLCGGMDIHPSRYGEEVNGSVNMEEARDVAEFALADAFIKAGKPIFGICRGFQLLNIYFGGSLIQHIDTADRHRDPDKEAVHLVTAEDGFYADTYGKEFSVNSYHHQAVKKLGNGLKVTLTSKEDGIIEGFDHESLPIFGVQFHPERMCHTRENPETVTSTAIFDRFIEMCKK
ncbi:MAG: gamma-glutamyl-gamma-aminobutyrate hydrolase family protein [Clostridia bacterium]|nr:gamma-glutamyl-gamma-aminobutyrate hydrolase family protein [Clostridia bacterium]